jgi:hypothetical protein
MTVKKLKGTKYAEMLLVDNDLEGGIRIRSKLAMTPHGELFCDLLIEAVRGAFGAQADDGAMARPGPLVAYCHEVVRNAHALMAADGMLAMRLPAAEATERLIDEMYWDGLEEPTGSADVVQMVRTKPEKLDG